MNLNFKACPLNYLIRFVPKLLCHVVMLFSFILYLYYAHIASTRVLLRSCCNRYVLILLSNYDDIITVLITDESTMSEYCICHSATLLYQRMYFIDQILSMFSIQWIALTHSHYCQILTSLTFCSSYELYHAHEIVCAYWLLLR